MILRDKLQVHLPEKAMADGEETNIDRDTFLNKLAESQPENNIKTDIARIWDQFYIPLTFRKLLTAQNFLSLDIDNDRIYYLTARKAGTDLQVKKWGELDLPGDEINRFKALQIRLESIHSKVYKAGMNVCVSFLSPDVNIRQIVLPKMRKKTDLRNAIYIQNQNDLPNFDDHSFWTYHILEEFDDDGIVRSRILVTIVPGEVIANYLTVLNQAGFKPSRLIPRPLAMTATYQKMVSGYARDVVIDISGDSTQICYLVNGEVQYVRNVAIGSYNIEKAIQKSVQPALPENEPNGAAGQVNPLDKRAQIERDAAFRWIEERNLSVEDSFDFNQYAEYLLLTRALITLKQIDKALYLSVRLYELAQRHGRIADMIEILLLQALALHARGYNDEALSALARALDLGEASNLLRPFLDEGEPLAKLLSIFLETREKSSQREYTGISTEYIETLLRALPTPETRPEPKEEKQEEEPQNPIRKRLLQKVRALQSKQNPVLQMLLGEIMRSLEYFQGNGATGGVERMFLTGSGIKVESVIPYLRDRVSVPIYLLAPRFSRADNTSLDYSQYFTALGTMLQLQDKFNVVPPDYRRKELFKNLNRLILVIIMFGALAAGYFTYIAHQDNIDKQKAVIRFKQEYLELNPVVKNYNELIAQIGQVQNEKNLLLKSVQSAPPLLNVLRFFSMETPPNIRLQKLEFRRYESPKSSRNQKEKKSPEYQFQVEIAGQVKDEYLMGDVILINFINHLNETGYFKNIKLDRKRKDSELKIFEFELIAYK